MGDVLTFAGFTQAIAFHRMGEDDGGLTFGFSRALESIIDFYGIVAAAAGVGRVPTVVICAVTTPCIR